MKRKAPCKPRNPLNCQYCLGGTLNCLIRLMPCIDVDSRILWYGYCLLMILFMSIIIVADGISLVCNWFS